MVESGGTKKSIGTGSRVLTKSAGSLKQTIFTNVFDTQFRSNNNNIQFNRRYQRK